MPTLEQRAGDFSQTRDAQGRMIVIYDPLTTTRLANGSVMRDAFPGNRIPEDAGTRWAATSLQLSGAQPGGQPGDRRQQLRLLEHAGRSLQQLQRTPRSPAHRQPAPVRTRLLVARRRGECRALAGPELAGRAHGRRSLRHVVVGDTMVLSPSTSLESRGASRARTPIRSRRIRSGTRLPQLLADLDGGLWPNFTVADVTGIGNGFMNDQPRDTYSLVGQVHRSEAGIS